MPPVNILIKPASSACNMRCEYCFYRDVADHREHAFEGWLTVEWMEKILASVAEYAEGTCTLAFQGGEPTLAGLDFYRQLLEIEKKYAKPGLHYQHAIQTNGYCIDEDWARFFADNRFLVGLSLDGPPELHNLYRKDSAGKGTSGKVLRAAQLFDKFHVDYNILCVITGRGARSIQRIYQYFTKQNFRWLQFIPCLEPLDQPVGSSQYFLSDEAYGKFLVTLFDLWYQDLRKGRYVSIRHFDNWLSILMGEEVEMCSMRGRCSIQFVIEGNGSVYPCDFYVLDEWKLGTAGETSFAEMLRSEPARRFIQESCHVPEECRTCKLYPLCRNGCRRDRAFEPCGSLGATRYCKAHKYFFSQRGQEFTQAARILMQKQFSSPAINK